MSLNNETYVLIAHLQAAEIRQKWCGRARVLLEKTADMESSVACLRYWRPSISDAGLAVFTDAWKQPGIEAIDRAIDVLALELEDYYADESTIDYGALDRINFHIALIEDAFERVEWKEVAALLFNSVLGV